MLASSLRNVPHRTTTAVQVWGGLFGLYGAAETLSGRLSFVQVVIVLCAAAFYGLALVAAVLTIRGQRLGRTLSAWVWGVQIPHLAGPALTVFIYAGWRLTITLTAAADLNTNLDLASGYQFTLHGTSQVPEFGVNVLAIVALKAITRAPSSPVAAQPDAA